MTERTVTKRLRIGKADARDAGTCTFCTRTLPVVVCVGGETGLVVRFCLICLRELRQWRAE